MDWEKVTSGTKYGEDLAMQIGNATILSLCVVIASTPHLGSAVDKNETIILVYFRSMVSFNKVYDDRSTGVINVPSEPSMLKAASSS